MRRQAVIIDVEGVGRTGWAQPEHGVTGRFMGVSAGEAAEAVRDSAEVEIRPGVLVAATDLTSVGAIAAIVSTVDGAKWALIMAPRNLLDLFDH